MTADPICYVRHVRSAKLCMGGARRWFAAHGLSWADFLKQGIPSSILGQWGDPLADRVIEQASREAESGR